MFLLYFKGQPHHMLLAVQDWKMAWLTARLLAYLISYVRMSVKEN